MRPTFRRSAFFFLLITGHGLLVTSVFAQVPQFINYQGRLIQGTNLFNGSANVKFNLYTSDTAVAQFYQSTAQVTVVDGLYNARIGEFETLGTLATALTNSQVFLEVVVNNIALTPRERVVSVPYAIRSGRADTLDGIDSVLFSLTGHTHDASAIVSGTLSDLRLSANVSLLGPSIESSEITDGSVSNIDLAANSVHSLNIINGTVSNIDLAANSVHSLDVIDGTISNIDLAANSVHSLNIINGTVSNIDLAADAVTGSKIADGTISNVNVTANTFWGTGGNAGTTPGTHFVGTSDGQALFIRGTNGVSVNGVNAFGELSVGSYQGGLSGSDVAGLFHQLTLGGVYNTRYNRTGVKLWIGDYDNDPGNTNYPIYVEDENNQVDFSLRARTNAGDRSVAYFGGKVGIGDANPSTLLTVNAGTNGNATILLQADTGNDNEDFNPKILFNQDGGANVGIVALEGDAGLDGVDTKANAMIIGNFSSNAVQFLANDQVAMTVDDTGFVGIGTNRPKASLHVMGGVDIDANGDGGYFIVGPKGDDHIMMDNNEIMARDGNSLSTLYLNHGWDTNLYYTTVSVRVEGTLGSQDILPDLDGHYSLGSIPFRWDTLYAENGFIQTSDARWKDNIKPLPYALETILKLRPVSFTWKNEKEGKVHLGLLAQEVEPVVPEAVAKDDNPDDPMGMSYETFVPILIKGMQDQQAEIEELRATVRDLTKRLDSAK